MNISHGSLRPYQRPATETVISSMSGTQWSLIPWPGHSVTSLLIIYAKYWLTLMLFERENMLVGIFFTEEPDTVHKWHGYWPAGSSSKSMWYVVSYFYLCDLPFYSNSSSKLLPSKS